jgi:hypothetical protein
VLYSSIQGKTAGLDSGAVLKTFARLSGGAKSVDANVVFGAANREAYPDLCEGIQLFSSPYMNDSGDAMTESGFLQLHVDMHAAKPVFFDDGLLLTLWL